MPARTITWKSPTQDKPTTTYPDDTIVVTCCNGPDKIVANLQVGDVVRVSDAVGVLTVAPDPV